MNIEKPTLWSKDFVVIFLSSFFTHIVYFLLMTTIAVYALEQFQASENKAGLASGIYIIGALVSRVFAGRYLEIVGRKKMLYAGLILMLLASLLYFPANNLYLLLIVRFIHGAGFGLATVLMATIAIDTVPPRRRGEGTGYYFLSATVATALGPLLGVLLLQYSSYLMLFVVSTTFSIFSFIIILFAKIKKTNITKDQIDEMKGFKWKNYFESKAIPISIIGLIIGFTYAGVISFVTAYSIEINMMSVATFFFVTSGSFSIVSRPFVGKLFDARGENTVMFPALIIYVIGFFVLSQVYYPFILLFAAALIGLSYGALFSATQALAIKEAPPHRIGLATSTYLIFSNVGVGVGSYIIGYIIEFVGYRVMYIMMGAVMLGCTYLYYVYYGRRKKSSEKVNLEARVTNKSPINVKNESQ